MTETEHFVVSSTKMRMPVSHVGLTKDTTDAIVITPFARLGLRSLDLVEVVMAAEQKYNIEIPDEVFLRDGITPAALAGEIDRRRQRQSA
ncbi:phosphopantetheine-binding protein [Lacticaseibacillus paracasei]|uniref:phosphopantetheine-binding protein n=1 Tax=Lacticaseibacillus paracasei TaxID=1597 RepID=UPI00194F86C6|nr:phosphopantetheine-binding protein [Lacticaseibacillus paracasei]MBM6453067.1 hypothetical protein [Lacticaseibacillus paracasei]